MYMIIKGKCGKPFGETKRGQSCPLPDTMFHKIHFKGDIPL